MEARAEQRVKDAERAKARMFKVPGKKTEFCTDTIDEDFMLLAAHVDELTTKRIAEGEYINFSKLIAKDRIFSEEDNRLEMIQRGGCTYWIPASDREQTSINSIEKWDQAFRVYSKIYVKFNPSRSEELVEYSFIFHSAAGTFSWNNVYTYDKLFRMHITKHPEKNWGIILHQAWSFCLTEKIQQANGGLWGSSGKNNDNVKKSGKICYKYNRGKCP